MNNLIKSRKSYLEDQITELNEKYLFGNLSALEKKNIQEQLSRFEKELMKLNNAIILNNPVNIEEESKKRKLTPIKKYRTRKV